MAGSSVFPINTTANPYYLTLANGGGGSGFVVAIVVADTSVLTGALAAAVPQYCMALVLSTKQIFVTEDNANWQAYS